MTRKRQTRNAAQISCRLDLSAAMITQLLCAGQDLPAFQPPSQRRQQERQAA